MGKVMQTAVCINLMKLLLMVFNIIFGVTGIVLLILGVWMKVSLYHVLNLSTDYNQHMPLVFIGTGIIVLLVSIVACVGTVKGQSVLLYIFGVILVGVFLLEMTAGVMGYMYIRQVKEGIQKGMNSSISHYGSGGMADENVDFVQKSLKCCGLLNFKDWEQVEYYVRTEGLLPSSCCENSNSACNVNNPNLHPEGCYNKIIGFLDKNLNAIAGGAVGFAFFQLFGVVLSFCLAANINKAKYERV
ncbi:tetraspanin-6-like [Ornithodoros turicata]|uniref:Tetraspanin n=1 Tax=Ornithodoros turicata TaxID=34597 RepID=A0A2R5LE09_9ACAR